ncbi:hypothetical protein J1614_005580 [Plenodomus biglobosus]|nr:hypothetical protein J1614_005580 [Plenodomus biglobosus]
MHMRSKKPDGEAAGSRQRVATSLTSQETCYNVLRTGESCRRLSLSLSLSSVLPVGLEHLVLQEGYGFQKPLPGPSRWRAYRSGFASVLGGLRLNGGKGNLHLSRGGVFEKSAMWDVGVDGQVLDVLQVDVALD